MSKEYLPLPRNFAEFLSENGYEETEPGCFELVKPEFPNSEIQINVVGKENEVLIIAIHAPREFRTPDGNTLFPQRRAICYAINRDFFTTEYWKFHVSEATRQMTLSLFLPFFNMHKGDQNGHLVMK